MAAALLKEVLFAAVKCQELNERCRGGKDAAGALEHQHVAGATARR